MSVLHLCPNGRALAHAAAGALYLPIGATVAPFPLTPERASVAGGVPTPWRERAAVLDALKGGNALGAASVVLRFDH
jgi:hypothetical protein